MNDNNDIDVFEDREAPGDWRVEYSTTTAAAS